MNITATLIALAVGVVIPGLTTLVTKSSASSGLRALLSGMLSTLGGALSGALVTPPANVGRWEQILLGVGVSWVTAGITYLTGWKYTAAAAWLERKTAKFGIGPKVAADPPGLAGPD